MTFDSSSYSYVMPSLVDSLAVGLTLCPSIYVVLKHIDDPEDKYDLMYIISIAVCGYVLVRKTIPLIQIRMPSILTGKDMCKKGTPEGDIPIPEALGIVSGTIFVICMVFGLTILANTPEEMVMFSAGLLSICFMMFLGFADDVLDLPWRYKLILPPIASLPLLVTYGGATAVMLPRPIRFLFDEHSVFHGWMNVAFSVSTAGDFLELGIFYKVYMGLLAVFCTNAINIYAGINGLEAGQGFIIGASILLLNTIQMARGQDTDNHHLFSAMFIIPFLSTTLGLLHHNWYPSRVFVGDTYCYYAGMTFAVVGILGHFSKTLLFFFVPQILNFVYSLPQLLKFVPCPRHRLPKFNPATSLVECSRITDCDTSRANFTLINLMLEIFGPMKERHLVLILLAFQVFCCTVAFVIRFYIAYLVYDNVN